MDQVSSSLQEYIKSGEYFKDARKWYNFKYIYPITQRSAVLIYCILFFIISITVILNIYYTFPIAKPVRYTIKSDSFKNNVAIIRADQFKNNPTGAVADIMIRNYIRLRESYDYDKLKKQFMYVQNNSTRIIFKQFDNFMSIDNPISPVIRYQDTFKRSIHILSVNYLQNGDTIATFQSIAENNANQVLESMIWQATISFEMDAITEHLSPGARFNFAVTNYKLKLLEDKSKLQQ